MIPEKKYNLFWKDIVENEDGSINMDQLQKELADFSLLIGNITKVYCDLTNGKISNPLTDPDVVIAVVEDCFAESFEENKKDGRPRPSEINPPQMEI